MAIWDIDRLLSSEFPPETVNTGRGPLSFPGVAPGWGERHQSTDPRSTAPSSPMQKAFPDALHNKREGVQNIQMVKEIKALIKSEISRVKGTVETLVRTQQQR